MTLMQPIDFDEALERIVQKDSRYPRDAYRFVRDALDHTQAKLARTGERATRGGRKTPKPATPTHVSGRELLEGVREFALNQFGPMVTTVFAEWGISQTADFGEIVFSMVDARLLNKTPEDNRADFAGAYDFKDAFERPFLPGAKVPHTDAVKPHDHN